MMRVRCNPCYFMNQRFRWELDVVKEFVVAEIRWWGKEAGDLHLHAAGVLQHVDASLGKEDRAALFYGFYDAIDHDTAVALHNIDDLFPVRMGVSRAHGLARFDFDHAHGAVL
ncbi:MAG TPA: hypothetical protein VFE22_06640 [Edaphobacter sp.]|nr:hypothetical protein [Edaphobacter sp.]